MNRFDPKRPHGVVYGNPKVRYEQDGVMYDAKGNPVKKDSDKTKQRGTDGLENRQSPRV